MKVKYKLFEWVIYTVLITVMLFLVFMSSVQFFCEEPVGTKYIYTVVLSTFVFCILVNITRYSLLLLIIGVFLPKPFSFVQAFKELISEMPNFVSIVSAVGYVVEDYSSLFKIILGILMFFLTVLVYYVSVCKRKSMYLILSGVIVYSFYFYNYENNNFVFDGGLFVALGMILFAFNNHLKDNSIVDKLQPQRNMYILKWLPSMVLLMAVVLMIAFFIPKRAYIKPRMWADNIVNSITKGFNGRSSKEYADSFSIAKTGFQENVKRLGGPVKLDNTVVLSVSSKDAVHDLHLRGSIKNYYSGESWQRVNADEETFTSQSMLKIDPSLNTSARSIDIEVKHKGISTHTIFNALYPLYVDIGDGYIFRDNSGQLIYSSNINKAYSLRIIQYSWERKNLINAQADNTDNELNDYISLPKGISDRVYSLTESITSPYDRPFIKASAIEKYLKDNYPYSINTTQLPEGAEFVDYFLFEEKKGSCTYYATAMAVMCRIAGIPSRYVEGFVVPSINEGKDVDVLNKDAHAWVELYFSNLGWVTFDPTPGWDSPSIYPDTLTKEDLIQDETQEPTNKTPKVPIGGIDNQDGNIEISKDQTVYVNHIDKYNEGTVIVIFSIILLLIVMIVMVYVYTHGKGRHYYLIYSVTRFGKTIGVSYCKGMSLREYFCELKNKAWIEMDYFIDYYEKIQYSKSDICNETEEAIIRDMYKNTVSRMGRLKASWIYITNPIAYIFAKKCE